MEYSTQKKTAAFLSIISNAMLIVGKLVAGFVSGSISIISEAIHSFSDLLASVLAFFSVSKSSIPADDDHQYGHGKYEDFSGLIEGALIIAASFYIIYEAASKLILNSHEPIDTTLGMAVMLFSVIANIFVSFYLFKVAKKTDSIALYADAEHLRTDVYSSLAVFLGLLAIDITHIYHLDSIIAIIVAIIIMSAGFSICKKSTNNLLDGRLPLEELSIITEVINSYERNDKLALKTIKTRKSGMTRLIELTLLVDAYKTIKEGHDLCDDIETKISTKLGNTDFVIHLEPINGD